METARITIRTASTAGPAARAAAPTDPFYPLRRWLAGLGLTSPAGALAPGVAVVRAMYPVPEHASLVVADVFYYCGLAAAVVPVGVQPGWYFVPAEYASAAPPAPVLTVEEGTQAWEDEIRRFKRCDNNEILESACAALKPPKGAEGLASMLYAMLGVPYYLATGASPATDYWANLYSRYGHPFNAARIKNLTLSIETAKISHSCDPHKEVREGARPFLGLCCDRPPGGPAVDEPLMNGEREVRRVICRSCRAGMARELCLRCRCGQPLYVHEDASVARKCLDCAHAAKSEASTRRR